MLKFIAEHVGERQIFRFNLECCRRIEHLMTDQTCLRALAVLRQFLDGDGDLERIDLVRDHTRNQLQTYQARWEEADREWAQAIRERDYKAARLIARDRVKMEERLAHTVHHAMIPCRNAWYSAWQTAEGCCSALEYHVGFTEDPIFGNTDSNTAEISAGTRREERDAQIQILRDFFSPACIRQFLDGLDPTLETDAQTFAHDASIVRSVAQSILTHEAFEKMPLLADALEENGCTDEEMLEHCRSRQIHHSRCWVLASLLRGSCSTEG